MAGGQKLKNKTRMRYRQAKTLFAVPSIPLIRHGPQIKLPGRTFSLACSTEGSRIAPVVRRYKRKTSANRYEMYRAEIERDKTSFRATSEPMLIRDSRIAMVAVVPMDQRGEAVRGLTCKSCQDYK